MYHVTCSIVSDADFMRSILNCRSAIIWSFSLLMSEIFSPVLELLFLLSKTHLQEFIHHNLFILNRACKLPKQSSNLWLFLVLTSLTEHSWHWLNCLTKIDKFFVFKGKKITAVTRSNKCIILHVVYFHMLTPCGQFLIADQLLLDPFLSWCHHVPYEFSLIPPRKQL